jgi:hypothetical protein
MIFYLAGWSCRRRFPSLSTEACLCLPVGWSGGQIFFLLQPQRPMLRGDCGKRSFIPAIKTLKSAG